ncbi:MAG: TonB-dependent receptor [Candidatus Eremiobacteraeota bacterium]|nr:TonB-dependent receptor [Candidatus Eremiobacteraeota bacterium]
MARKVFVYAVLFALAVLVFQGTWTLAGTTGALSGQIVLRDGGAPVAGAKVTVSSPSQTVSTTSNAEGRFNFVSLNPDTYTVTVSKEGYEPTSRPGVTVLADNTQTVNLQTSRAVKTIGEVTTRAAAELVRPGTTSDVYSVSATTQAKAASLGGGGGLDQAYSAIASVPGVVAPPGQSGWFQTLYIRGGDYDQVGYELDGVPVVRSYDNYPVTNASALGQQELQVYTGASPANSESSGLSGYINQVIKSGTYPGFASTDLGIGGPALYNKANLEVGGATPNRNFSYYVGVGLYDQAPRALDNSNGADVTSNWGAVFALAPCPVTDSNGNAVAGGSAPANNNVVSCYTSGIGPGGYILAPYNYGSYYPAAHLADRENVVNLHFGIPHRDGAGKDDVQLLYDTSEIYNDFYMSALDAGLNNVAALTGTPYFTYGGSAVYTGQLDQPLPANYASLIKTYNFPNQAYATPGSAIPINHRDGQSNGQSIVKLQYQHNMSSNAYFRIYGYTYYSDWLNNGPDGLNTYVYAPSSVDYELSNHTSGMSATFADQINNKNLINFEASVTRAFDYRMNNFTPYDLGSYPFAFLVDSTNPKNGICYAAALNADGSAVAPGAAAPISCGQGPDTGSQLTLNDTAPALNGALCGNGPCQFFVAENGLEGGGNNGYPIYRAVSLQDQINFSSKLLVNLGVRYDRFDFHGSNTSQAPGSESYGSARDFWFNAYNQDRCVSTAPAATPVLKPDPTQSCAANFGPGYVPAHLTNLPYYTNKYNVFEPRLGATYTISPDDVLRLSAGKYTEAPGGAYQQYNVQQQDLPGYDNRFYGTGFHTTSRYVKPAVSYNYDFSVEHHFRNTQASMKLTPYLRETKDQVQNFFLDQKTGFISGLNAGKQTTSGLEFQLNYGDFNRNGLSGTFSYTYTHAFIKYAPFQNGTTVLDAINQGVQGYNAYTKACAGNTTNPACGGGLDSAGQVAAACYDSSGAPDPTCAAGSIANPYWNAPAQPLFDPSASYIPYSTIPGGLDSASQSFITPHSASLILNYKRNKLAISPAFQFFSGGYYGAPFVTPGIDPAAGCSALTGSPSGDPRYPYGAAGGAPYDATTCGGTLLAGIPDPYTKKFDNLGDFKQPNQFLAHLQLSYEASPRVTLTANLANIVNTCFGGDKPAWSRYSDRRVCSYGLPLGGAGVFFPAGNSYNPGSTFQPEAQYPYQQVFGTSPFEAYFDVKVRL